MTDTIQCPVPFMVTVLKALETIEAAIDDYLGDDYETAADALDALGREIDQACGGLPNSIGELTSQLTCALLDHGVKL